MNQCKKNKTAVGHDYVSRNERLQNENRFTEPDTPFIVLMFTAAVIGWCLLALYLYMRVCPNGATYIKDKQDMEFAHSVYLREQKELGL